MELSYLFVFDRPTGQLPYVAHTHQAEYEMVLANWMPRDTYREKYPMGRIPARGAYSYPIRSIFPVLSTLSILQDRGSTLSVGGVGNGLGELDTK